MKKAKVLLAAIAVMAVIGGSFAFKAATRGALTYYTTALPNVAATNPLPNAIIDNSGTARYWTIVSGDTPANFDKVLSSN